VKRQLGIAAFAIGKSVIYQLLEWAPRFWRRSTAWSDMPNTRCWDLFRKRGL